MTVSSLPTGESLLGERLNMNAPSVAAKHYRTCPLCEAMCGLEIAHKDDEILSIRGDNEDPFSRGHICPKAVALQDLHHDPDRLKYPVRRTENGWQQIGWTEAFETVAEKLLQIQAGFGRDAVATYVGNPNVHNLGAILYLPGLHQALNTRNRFASSSVDQLPHQFVSLFLFGHDFLLPVPDIDRTDYFLMFGANPIASNGSLMAAPDIAERLKDIHRRGGKTVVIDPRHTETSQIASQHVFIRPGTDVLLLLAMLNTLFTEGLANPGKVADIIDGIETIEAICADYPPVVVAKHTGIPAEEIQALARDFAQARSSVCHGRIGTCIQEFGALTQWLLAVLNIVAGRLDTPGGYMFPTPAVDVIQDLVEESSGHGHYAQWRSRIRGLPEFGGELPAATLADEILTDGEGQIKALVTFAGNPRLSLPNSDKIEEALEKLDFIASIDFYINETTRHADIILPPTGALEHEHYDLVFNLLTVRNSAKYSPPLFAPAADTRHDWQILAELQKRLQLGRAVLEDADDALSGFPHPDEILDQGLRRGPYGATQAPDTGLTLEKLKQSRHGIDFGPLQACLPGRLFTHDKRIPLAPEVFLHDLQRVQQKWFQDSGADNGFDLLLIGRRHLRSNNSWMHNSERLVKGKNRCTAMLHPRDAGHHQIRAGEMVRVSSRVGTLVIEAEVTEDIMPGTVSIPHGWGHDLPGVELQTARRNAGINVNIVTDEQVIDELSGTVVANGIPVRIEHVAVPA